MTWIPSFLPANGVVGNESQISMLRVVKRGGSVAETLLPSNHSTRRSIHALELSRGRRLANGKSAGLGFSLHKTHGIVHRLVPEMY